MQVSAEEQKKSSFFGIDWFTLFAGQRSNAATSLLKAAEDSATMLANVGQQQTDPTPAFEKRLQYENIGMCTL